MCGSGSAKCGSKSARRVCAPAVSRPCHEGRSAGWRRRYDADASTVWRAAERPITVRIEPIGERKVDRRPGVRLIALVRKALEPGEDRTREQVRGYRPTDSDVDIRL